MGGRWYRVIPIGDEVRRRTLPITTYMIVCSNVLVFAYALSRGLGPVLEEYGFKPVYLYTASRLSTLVTSMFLHGDPLHLAGNMLFLYVFGRSIEDRLGPLTYLALYTLSGVAGSLLHSLSLYLLSQEMFESSLTTPLVGASGAISGVVGAYVILYPRARIKTLVLAFYIVMIRVPARLYILAWFAYQLLIGVIALRTPLLVAPWAHIGGFAVGAAALLLVKHHRLPLTLRY
ncbi:MAG: rhomboid family intramembrane serine protease [Thermoprotei archaeon]|nr:MAG: rhomboid family intramembrane serine protease [Thermoprotei archaeon]